MAVSCKYVSSDQPFKMNFRNTLTNTIEEIILPNYDSFIRATRQIKLPSACAVPTAIICHIIKVLHNHGFVAGCTGDSKLYATEGYFIQSLKRPKGDDKPASEIKVIVTCKERNLDTYEIFCINNKEVMLLHYS